MPRISVIMGIYNCAPTLQEALDSLYAQTYQDFEIVLCDDGSTDNTYEIALKNQKKHPNIVLLKNTHNMGLNQTLNNCLAIASGQYIARMDGDDISLPDRFEVLSRFLDEHADFAIVTSPMYYFDEDGVFMEGKGKGEIYKTDFKTGSPICHAPCMVRKIAYDKVGGYTVAQNLLRIEDLHLWGKMYAAGYKAYMVEKPYYMMRDDRNAKSRRKLKNRFRMSRVLRMVQRMIGLPWYYRIYSIRPIIVGLLPSKIYDYLHRNRFKS